MMKKLIFITLSFLFICLVSWSIVYAVPNPYHPAHPTNYSKVSDVVIPTIIGSRYNENLGTGVSVYTEGSENGLCYFLDQTRMLISGQTSFHNRGLGTATYLNAGVTRTWYNRITDRLEIAQQNDISFHSLAGRDYFDCSDACTGYLLYSEDFTDVVWDKLQTGITLYGTDPMGGEKAMFLREDNANNPHAVRETIAKEVFADNAIVTFSFFVKADSRTWVLARMSRKNALVCGTYFDVANGIIGSTAAGGVSNVQISEQPINGSYRVSVTGSIAAGADDPTFGVYLCTGDSVASYQGDANSGMTIWGAQVTQTAWLAPYFATEASAVLYPSSAGSLTYACPQGIFAETLGSELVTNGDCSIDSFTSEAGWAYDGVADEYDATAATNSIYQAISTVAGDLWKISFEVKNYVDGIVDVSHHGKSTSDATANETYTFYLTGSGVDANLYIRGNNFTGSVDNISCRKVTNARTSTITDGLMPPHGTFMFYATPLFDADDMETYCGLFNFDGETGTTGFYISSSGRYALGDGTNTAYGHASSGVSAWETSKVVGQWGFLINNVSYMRVGVDRGEGLVWGSNVAYDGAFPEVLFSVFEEGWGRVLLGGPWIWNRIPSDTELYWFGGSP